MRNFALVSSFALPVAPTHATLCPTMDILVVAIGNSDGTQTLAAFRLGSKEKIWTVNEKSKITAFAWRPDGWILAVGLQDGSIKLLNVSAGNLIHQIRFDSAFEHQPAAEGRSNDPRARLAAFAAAKRRAALKKLNPASASSGPETAAQKQEAITAICWGQQPVDCHSFYDKEDPAYEIGQKFLSIGSHYELGGSDNFMLLGAQKGWGTARQPLNVLVAANAQQKIQLNINGVFQLASFCIDNIGKSAKFTGISINSAFDSIHIEQEEEGTASLLALENPKSFLPLPAHFGRDAAISKMASLASLSFSLRRDVLDSVESMLQEWRAFHDIGSQKMKKLVTCLEEQEVTNSPEFEWLLAVAGNKASAAFDSFLGQELTDRHVKNWKKILTLSFASLRVHIKNTFVPACEKLYRVVTDIAGFSRWPTYAECFATSKGTIARIQQLILCLFCMADEILKLTAEYEGNFEVFAGWIQLLNYQRYNPITDDEEVARVYPPENLNAPKLYEFITSHLSVDPFRCFFSVDNVLPASVLFTSGDEQQNAVELIGRDNLPTLKTILGKIDSCLREMFNNVGQKLGALMKQELKVTKVADCRPQSCCFREVFSPE